MFLRHFQPLLPPDPLHPLVVDPPALCLQQRRDPLVAVAPVCLRQTDDVRRQALFIAGTFHRLSQRAAALAQRPAHNPLRIAQNLPCMNNGLGAALRRGQNFPFEISFNIWLSTVRSATARLSRAFSASSPFIRFAWSSFKPPYSLRHR